MAAAIPSAFKNKKALVLLSSGLDSTINFYEAKSRLGEVAAITFDYGQRASKREQAQAKKIAKALKSPHAVIDLRWLGKLGQSSLTDKKKKVPGKKQVDIESLQTSHETAKSVWVPNRNGVFLNVAAAIAEAYSIPLIIPGFNIEEAATFPDNTKEFMNALDNSFGFSTNHRVQTECYTVDLDKKQIVALGRSLGVKFDLIWPCYFGGAKPCGECESCQRFNRATNFGVMKI